MSEKPLISFCIPTYYRAHHLRETLECLLPQLGSDVDVVISDHSSTDETEEVVQLYQWRSPRVRYTSNKVILGYDRNLLRCLESASGEYAWFFGSDDLLDGDAVETVRRRILQSRQRPALVYVNHQVVDNECRRWSCGEIFVCPWRATARPLGRDGYICISCSVIC